jgi:transcriptional regulator with XRE-family HTH domain
MSFLRELREKSGLTQAELADRSGTSQPQIMRLEKGERKLTELWAERLAPHLGASAVDLVFRKRRRRQTRELVDRQAFGRRVADRRTELRISQTKLAAMLGMRQQGIAAIEAGKVARPRFLPELAATLGATTDWLLYGDGGSEARGAADETAPPSSEPTIDEAGLNGVLTRIEHRLKVTGLSARRASLKASLSGDAIRNIRRAVKAGARGGVTIGTIAALAPVLGTTASWLLEARGEASLMPSQLSEPSGVDSSDRSLPAIHRIAEIERTRLLSLAEEAIRFAMAARMMAASPDEVRHWAKYIVESFESRQVF